MLNVVTRRSPARMSVVGYETNPAADVVPKRTLDASFAHVEVDIRDLGDHPHAAAYLKGAIHLGLPRDVGP